MKKRVFCCLIGFIFAAALVPMSLVAEGQTEASEGRLLLYADMVRGHTNPTLGPTCALTSQYLAGEMIVWRMRIFDTSTDSAVPRSNKELFKELPDNDALAALSEGFKVTVHLSDGQSFPAHFGPHGGETPLDYFWTTSWEISDEYPTGTLDYWVTVELSGTDRSGRYDPFPIAPSKLTIIPKA